MTREIEFRAYEPSTKTLHYDINIGFTTWGEVIVEPDFGESEPFKDDHSFRLINPIVSQYTGINDKNGKKIYEGDIVECNPNFIGDHRFISKVSFDQGMFGVVWLEYTHTNQQLKLTAFDIEVIGNIYENKELIDE